MASSCKGVSVPPNYESHYSVMDEDFSASLHILDQSERDIGGCRPFAHVIRMNTIKHGSCCKLMLQIDSLHKKGTHNQCNFTANYSTI